MDTDEKNAMQKKEKAAKVKAVIVNVLLWLIIGGFILLGIFNKELFGKDNWFADMFGTNIGQMVSVFNKDTLDAVLSALVYIVVIVAVYKVVCYILRATLKKSRRGRTILNLILSFIKYAMAIVAILLVLSAFGVDTTTLLASAGILALVVGLGAQSLIEDIISGLFIVFEGEYEEGDIVVIDGFRGNVTSIGIRTTQLIDASGNIKIVNNSDIRNVINMSNDLSLAICDVDIEYGESLERVETVIKANLDVMKSRIPDIIEGPYYKGVAQLGSSGVTIKLISRCKEDCRFQVERDMNREIKIIFDKNDINIPFPQVVVNQPKEFGDVSDATRKMANSFVDQQKSSSKGIEDEQNT